ncbi:hypothetical protein [Flavobacterium sp.]|uniref:hypothetical protein n=1 Tax=Flavobacterium sp. TaxID=239 RepID=UPI00286DB028|nr:hypothetical protein [Flavobacterium sp.]
MKIVSTFVPNLYAFQFPNGEFDELGRVFDDWENPLFLFEFFQENETDLKEEFSIAEAVEKTREQVKKFRKRMLDLAKANPHQLNEFFANLYNNEYKTAILPHQKAKQSWLRLYALKITEEDKQDLYVITGGMIKLTQNIEDRDHGKEERNKIIQCRDYLKTIGVYDNESFFEICF